MPRFIVLSPAIVGDELTLTGRDAAHLAGPLRTRPGARIQAVCAEMSESFGVDIVAVERDRIVGRIVERVTLPPLPTSPRVTVAIACLHDRMDEVIDSLTQLGVARILPLVTDKTVGIPKEKLAKRIAKWRAIAADSSITSWRVAPPVIDEPLRLATWEASGELAVLCHLDPGSVPLVDALPFTAPEQVEIIVGPEGGWSNSEIATTTHKGARMVHLGPRSLAARVAAPLAVSAVVLHYPPVLA